MAERLRRHPDAARYRAGQRDACPACLARRARAGEPDADGLVRRRHRRRRRPDRAHRRPAGSATDAPRGRPRPAAWSGPAFVDMPHPHRQGPHLAAHAQSRRHLHGRARRGQRRPRGATGRPTTSRARMDFCLRCAYAHGTAALRTHLDSLPPQHRHLLAGLRRDARALDRPHRAAGACRSSPSTQSSTSAFAAELSPTGRRAWRRARRRHLHGPRPRRACSSDVAPRREIAASTSISTSTRPPTRRRARSAASPTPRSAPASRAAILVGHCCSLAHAGRRRGRGARIDTRRRGRHRRRLACRCATCTCRTASAGRTPRWRGVTLLHELTAARRPGRGRLRQHPRSVLRLWRPRHARGLPRGGAHPPSRPPVRRLGRAVVARARPRSWASPDRGVIARRRAGRPRPLPRPRAGPSFWPVRSPTASVLRTGRAIDTHAARLSRARRALMGGLRA